MRFLSTLLASALGTLVALGFIFFLMMLFFFAVIAASDEKPSVRTGSVLTMELRGSIPEMVSGDPFMKAFADEPGYDLIDVVSAIDRAAADDRIEAIWMRVRDLNAPWTTLGEIRAALLRFREAGKPIYASSEDHMMAEAEYYLASAADSVFASEQAMFELNGFFLTVEFFQSMMEKLDVEPQIVRAGRYKSAVEPFMREDLSPENEEQLAALLNAQNTVFMNAVAESRGMTPDSLNARITRNAVISATEAHEMGLLDGLLFEDEVIDLIKARLGVEEEDEDLETIGLSKYVGVPADDAGLEVNRDGDIAVVYAEGVIVSGESGGSDPFSGAMLGSETFAEAMEEAREDEDVKAVVVRVNSPGGSASASDAMWRAIKLTADEKPVVISMGSLAASGGYWISTAAETIVADPLTITGSIGVFGLLMDVSGLFENKFGITFDGVRTSPYADMFSAVRPLSDGERAMLERWIDETYQDFLQKVSDSRGIPAAQVDSIAQGRIWAGVDALRIGLVDSLGSLKDAIRIAAEKAELGEGPYSVKVLPRPKTFIEELTSAMNARAANVWLGLTRSPAEQMILRQAKTLSAMMNGTREPQARMLLDVAIE